MEQNPNEPQPQSPSGDAPIALAWACDVLDLDAANQANTSKETRTDALVSFFKKLQSNDFHAPEGSTEAVEILHGKSPDLLPAFVQTHQKNQTRQLDDLLDWFTNQLGNRDHEQLVASLGRKLSRCNFDSSSTQVKSYGKKIWAAAQSVTPPVNENNEAVKKIVQGLFHTSTTRPVKRRELRHRYVNGLKEKHSREQLTEARKEFWARYQVPNEIYHQPFLSLLTFDEEFYESYQIADPVYAGTQTVPYGKSFGTSAPTRAEQEESKNWRLFGWIAIVCLGAIIKFSIFAANNNQSSPVRNPARVAVPKFQFDPNLPPEDPRSIESALRAMRTISGEDSDLPMSDEFQELDERAEALRRRNQELRDSLKPSIPAIRPSAESPLKAMKEAREKLAQHEKAMREAEEKAKAEAEEKAKQQRLEFFGDFESKNAELKRKRQKTLEDAQKRNTKRRTERMKELGDMNPSIPSAKIRIPKIRPRE